MGCELSVLIKCSGDDERGYDSDDEMQRSGDGEHAAETDSRMLGY